jgi:uncharacterized iron-regulated membrane protein
MIVSRNAAGARFAGRKIVAALGVAGLLATLAACAGGASSGTLATSATATAAAPAAAPEAPAPVAAAPAPATTTAAAPKAAPRALTPTEINEQCWMNTEVNKVKDLDKKAKLVDNCVAEKMKAQQGM